MVVDLFKRFIQTRLFRRAAQDLGPWQVIGWWEARRLSYNLIVGATGVVSAAIIITAGLISEHLTGEPIGLPDPPIFAVVAVVFYGVMANVCFTGGWIVELLVTKAWGLQAGAFGEISFFLGVVFSVLLTLAPAGLAVIFVAFNLVFYAPE